MKAEIDGCGGQFLGGAPPVERRDTVSRAARGRERGAAGDLAIRAGEDGERAVADELQHVAALLMDRRDHRFGIIIEEGDDLAGRGDVGDARVVMQIAEPERRLDAIGDAALDASGDHPLACVTPEIGFDERARDARERGRFHRESEHGHEPLELRDVLVLVAALAIRRP